MNNTLKPIHPGEYAVLLYHGVYADDLDLEGRNSSGKHLAAGEFRVQMELLARDWNVVSMQDIARAHYDSGSLPPRAVAVTFDDGFANIYHVAWPILRQHGIVATFYLATGFVGTGRVSWTDRLEIMLLDGPSQSIQLSIGGEVQDFYLGDVGSRVIALTEIKRQCKQLPFPEVESVLEQVQAGTGIEPVSSHPLYETLGWDQVREMANDGLFEFGAHTVDHIPLTRMPFKEMTCQVKDSLRKVSDELGTGTKLFSYPEGQQTDFDQQSISFLKSIGLDHCPTAIEGLNDVNSTDPFLIHRCMVGFENRPFILT